jgi:hypothetical protein
MNWGYALSKGQTILKININYCALFLVNYKSYNNNRTPQNHIERMACFIEQKP